MALVDCLKKISGMDPADIAAIKASVEAKVNNGATQADAERQTVEEHAQTVMAGVEDIRKQLNAPAPASYTSGGKGPSATQEMGQPLAGVPKSSPGEIESFQKAAQDYMKEAGLPYSPATTYVKADPERGKRIADAYEAMKDDIDAPGVREAYEALAAETLAQWEAIKKTGLKVEMIKGENPYTTGPGEALADMKKGHLWVFPTESGFGDNSKLTDSTNPMLAKTGEKIGDHELLVNDVFRIVHDVFGHGKDGVGFGPNGEENAWQSHVRMYSPSAAKAMTTETRGQNSWVNFGPKGKANRANQKETVYADQKLGLLPDWTLTEGAITAGGQSTIVVAGEAELGNTIASRQKYFELNQPEFNAPRKVRELSGPAQEWFDGLDPQQKALIEEDVALRLGADRDAAGDLGNLKFALQIAARKKPKTLEQPGHRGSIVYVGETYILNMFKGADYSTLIHEMGHMFLWEMRRTVKTGLASPATVERYQILMDYLGNAGEDFSVKQHEKMAVVFEAYALEGKAPSAALKKPFGQFRRWLTRIYGRVVENNALAGLEKTAGIKIDLTPEIREVFDRMLTLEPEVREAALDAEFAAADIRLDKPEGSGEELDKKIPAELRGDSRVRINDLLDEARQGMEDRLFEHRSAAIAAKKPAWKKAADADVAEQQIYKAAHFLSKHPLDRTQIQSEYGTAAFQTLSTKHGSLVTNETDVLGLDPDIAAEQFGFEDGKALIDALRKAPTEAHAARMALKALADAEWESYGPAEAMAETPEFADVMDASRAYLAEALGRPGGVDKKAIRQQAEQYISTLPVKQAADVEAFLQDMARLQRQEREAVTKGDLAMALQKNAQARLNFEMARIARKLKEEVKAIVKRAKGLKNIDLKKTEYDYAMNAIAVAERYGFLPATAPTKRTALRVLLNERNDADSDSFEPAMDTAAAFPDWILNEQQMNFKDMTIDDLTDVDHMMRFLVARGTALRSSDILDGKAKLEQVEAELLDKLSQMKDKKVFEEGTLLGKVVGFADSFLAALNIWQFRVRAIDGFTAGTAETGPAEKYLFDPLHQKANERAVRWEALQKLTQPAFKHLSARTRSMPRYVDGLEATAAMKAKGRPGWTFENVIVAALNMGSTYNAEAMAAGLGYTLEDGTPDTSRLSEITKSLTKADWDAVVAIGEAIHSQQADLSAVFERRNGFPMALVEPEPFKVTSSDGEKMNLKGWYYPVKFDPLLSDRQEQQEAAEDRLMSAFSAFPMVGTRTGMTKRRTSTGGKALLLSLSGLDSHLKDVTQYITYAETVADVFRITQHKAFKAAFSQKFGDPAFKQIRNMLADIGMPDQQAHTKADQFLGWLKGMSTAWALGGNIKVALTQPFSAFNYASDEGAMAVAIGLKHVMTAGPTAARDLMFKLSPFMKERWVAADREVSDSIQSTNWLSNPKLKAVQDGMFALIQISDHSTMLPLWWGSFHKRIAAGATEAEAALGADKAMLATYPGNPRPLDASAALRSKNGLIRLATSFATQAFHFGNRQRFYASAMLAGKISKANFFGHVMLEGVAAPLVMTAFFDALWGNWPPDDKEDKRKYLLSLGTYQFTGLPVIKEIANWASNPDFTGHVSSLKGLEVLANSAGTVGRLALDLEDDKDPRYKKALLAMADLTSFYYKIPASRMYEKYMRGQEQLDQFPNDDAKLKWLNDIFTVLSPDPDKRTK